MQDLFEMSLLPARVAAVALSLFSLGCRRLDVLKIGAICEEYDGDYRNSNNESVEAKLLNEFCDHGGR